MMVGSCGSVRGGVQQRRTKLESGGAWLESRLTHRRSQRLSRQVAARPRLVVRLTRVELLVDISHELIARHIVQPTTTPDTCQANRYLSGQGLLRCTSPSLLRCTSPSA